jgi:hypothetical protein
MRASISQACYEHCAHNSSLRRDSVGSKNQPGEFDCYAAAEPMFVLLGRDEDAPQRVEDWCRDRLAKLMASELTSEQLHRGVRKIAEALVCANRMRDWRARNRTTPDFFNVPPLRPLPLLSRLVKEEKVWATGLGGPGEKLHDVYGRPGPGGCHRVPCAWPGCECFGEKAAIR